MAHTSVKRGFFRNAVEALMAARERQARSYVASTLLMFDDETLEANGFSRAELKHSAGPRVTHLF